MLIILLKMSPLSIQRCKNFNVDLALNNNMMRLLVSWPYLENNSIHTVLLGVSDFILWFQAEKYLHGKKKKKNADHTYLILFTWLP